MVSEKKKRVGVVYLLMTQTNEEVLKTQYYSMENEAKVRELTIQHDSLRLTTMGAEKQRSKTLPQGHTVTD